MVAGLSSKCIFLLLDMVNNYAGLTLVSFFFVDDDELKKLNALFNSFVLR